MITSAPVGTWVWEPAARGIAGTAAGVWHQLAGRDLVAAGGSAALRVSDAADPRDVRVELSGLDLGAPLWAPDSPVVRAVERADALEGDLVAVLRVDCPGTWLEPGRSHRAEKLFAVQVEVWGGTLLVVTLETYSDAWLTVDTRGREQPGVHALNAPRLAAALDGISAFLGTPPTPGDENRYAIPSETGFADPRVEGPAYDDAWGTFERLDRTRLLDSRLPRCDEEYEQVTEAPVRYAPVRRDGVTLGYVWAATDDSAAGYVPRTAAGDAAFDAGAVWLSDLRRARGRGLAPLCALELLLRLPARARAGIVSGAGSGTAPSLEDLEERSGRY
ncbi:hypothetical protein [Streptomyces sp. NPDC013181]|uniref:hypothetical protein n=1 Tax=Streptomyces sp. NPDC013181 TaxID=3364864 RepID=UPI00369DA788